MSPQPTLTSPSDSNLPTEDLLQLVKEHEQAIKEFIYILGTATPMESEVHIVRVTMWDDRCNDMRELLTRVLKGIKQ